MTDLRSSRLLTGAALAALVALVIVGVLLSIAAAANARPAIPVDIGHLLRMTAIQAGLSTLLSLAIGLLLAWALNRRQFPGRALLVGLLSAALVTPGIAVGIGLITVWGRAGWANHLLAPLGLQTGSIFGLHGILYAHVILDATFAARILLDRLDNLPATRLKMAQSLDLPPWARFRLLDWPAMAGTVPGLAAIIFLLAFTSFPVILLLGGGPANQTFEVAIYSAVRLDFDLAAAVRLALVQLVFCAVLVVPATYLSPAPARAGISRAWAWREPSWLAAIQMIVVALAVLLLLTPLAAVLVDGLSLGGLLQQSAFWRAAITSLGIGTASALLTLCLALLIAMARSAARHKLPRALLAAPAYLYLALPAVTLSLGFFLAARRLGLPPQGAGPFVLVLANALMALPFALSTLGPSFDMVQARYGRLARALDLGSFTRLKKIELPLMSREIGLVLAMGFCFSLGDLGVIALFGTEDFSTLPWLMVRALGAYRTNDAAAIGAILLVGCIGTFIVLPPAIEKLMRYAQS